MNNKNILIVAPFFPPETHAAVFRAHKLTKYLKKNGWNPMVLTVDTNYNFNEDPRLLDELEGIPIFRTKYVEPTLRGIRMLLSDTDLTYKSLKRQNYFSNTGHTDKKPRSKWIQNYTELFLNSPDRYWTWQRSAIKKAEEIIQNYNVNILFTTCSPYTSNAVGLSLKKKYNLKWIADFRDPVTYAKRTHSDVFSVYKKQRKNQDDTFLHADGITTTSSAYELIFNDQYKGRFSDKVHFIPTGVDDDYLPEDISSQGNYIIFAGEYLEEYGDFFFRVYSKAIDQINKDNVMRIKIVGNKDINMPFLLPIIEKYGIQEFVEIIDHMPQKELYKLISEARYALTIIGEKAHWWNNSAKLTDYIALQKQVIALVPDISETKSELSKAGLGIFIKQDEKSIRLLTDLFNGGKMEQEVDKKYCKRYLASNQVKSFINLFEKV
ncbi:MAG: hypothetical protein LBV72_10985 [Tannerella sp.]|jgi:hypothetical protein|nr:hypothetical protein [Tannerella sp.]